MKSSIHARSRGLSVCNHQHRRAAIIIGRDSKEDDINNCCGQKLGEGVDDEQPTLPAGGASPRYTKGPGVKVRDHRPEPVSSCYIELPPSSLTRSCKLKRFSCPIVTRYHSRRLVSEKWRQERRSHSSRAGHTRISSSKAPSTSILCP